MCFIYEGTLFEYYDRKANWSKADNYCREMDFELYKPSTREEILHIEKKLEMSARFLRKF